MKTKIQLKNRYNGSVLFEFEAEDNSVRTTVLEAVSRSADLSSADLRFADLRFANLRFANLSSANLRFANLSSADLRSADLSSADLRSADLSSADLSSANLRSADLSSADLRFANLRSADLSFANLRSADLRVVKNDFWSVLLNAIPEVSFLKKSLVEGKVDGSTYTGECACLMGTIEKVAKGDHLKKLVDLRDSDRPIERLFMGINKGDTPETNQVSKIVLGWLEEFEQLIGVQQVAI